jgi:glycosyltransferase involved in cell wall biosynthesis
MKVLIINSYLDRGGAAVVAKTLGSLAHNDINTKTVSYNSLYPNSLLRKLFIKKNRFTEKLLTKILFSKINSPWNTSFTSPSRILKEIKKFKPDLVHLHWIGDNLLSLDELKKITVPIIWTLHDSWVFTGGCHLPYPCEKFLNQCGKCPVLESNDKHDLSFKFLQKKKEIFKKLGITFVTPSLWLQSLAKKSSLLKDSKVIHIPNFYNFSLKKKKKVSFFKEINSLKNKKVLLYIANNFSLDPNKGFQIIRDFIAKNNDSFSLIAIGDKLTSQQDSIYTYPYFSDKEELSALYRLADITVVPSKTESFSLVALESLIHETPVVTFDLSAPKELIAHTKNGYIAKSFDEEDFHKGINFCLSLSKELIADEAKKLQEKYHKDKVLKLYYNLYQAVLNEKKN